MIECSKLAGPKWASMGEKERAPYEKLHEHDAARVVKQNAERAKKGYFTLDDGSKSTDEKNAKLFKQSKGAKSSKKAGKKSDSDSDDEEKCLPKRPTSAYLFFNSEYSKKMREKHPEEKSMTFFSNLVKEKWASMSEEDKKSYVALNEADKARYDKEKKDVADKGFFMLADGSKSTDAKNIPKRKSTNKSKVEKSPEKKMSVKDVKAKMGGKKKE